MKSFLRMYQLKAMLNPNIAVSSLYIMISKFGAWSPPESRGLLIFRGNIEIDKHISTITPLYIGTSKAPNIRQGDCLEKSLFLSLVWTFALCSDTSQ